MNKSAFFLAALLALLYAAEIPLDRIAAVIDDDIILESELNELARFSFQNNGKAVPTGVEFDEVRRQLLESMIEDKLLLKQAEAESIKVSREEVNALRDNKIESFVSQVGSLDNLEKVLMQNYGLTVAKLKKNLEKQINEELMKMRLVESLKQKRSPTRKEVERFFADYRDSLPNEKSSIRLSHIMKRIAAAPAIVEKARKRIESAEAKLQAGVSFEKLAEAETDDAASAKNGGDLGFFTKGFLDKNFEKTAFSLNVGEISPVVRSRYGYHLIKLEERRGEKEIRVRHILTLILPDKADTLRAVAFLDSLAAFCGSDSAFAKQAVACSDDKLTAHKGGDLGWLSEEGLEASYQGAIKGLNVGENSRPVIIDDAVHLFRVCDRRSQRSLDLDNDFETIRDFASNYLVKQDIKSLCGRMRQKLHVENRLAPAVSPE
ncbi:MAG: hypothetical protein A2293_12075 [Elusimicrobia bacterium RIFOXYB2_FULL_49_7]|nr:MAG: hypothetical protein A2293_12075 [Elusimicrobia bacterium RIFOXYB2_FULL_49_7]